MFGKSYLQEEGHLYSSTIVVAFRDVKWEKTSLPVDVGRSKASLLKFPHSTGLASWRSSLLSYGFLWRGEDCFRPKIIGENCCDEASMPRANK